MKIANIKSIAFIQNLTKAYTEGVYADTPANRKLGRVGMSYKEWTQKQQGGNEDEEQKSIKENLDISSINYEGKFSLEEKKKIQNTIFKTCKDFICNLDGSDKPISDKQLQEVLNDNNVVLNVSKEKNGEISVEVGGLSLNRAAQARDLEFSGANWLNEKISQNIYKELKKEKQVSKEQTSWKELPFKTKMGRNGMSKILEMPGVGRVVLYPGRMNPSREYTFEKEGENYLNRKPISRKEILELYNNYKNGKINTNKKENQKVDLTSKKFSEETNDLLREASSLLSDDFDHITKETGLGKDIFEKKGIKYYIESVSNRIDDQGAIFTDGKGNFWDLSYSDSQGVFLRKINEGVTKNPLRPALQDALRNTLKYSKIKLDNLIKEGKIDKWIKNEISVLKDEDKERPGYHHVYNSLPLAYVNKKKNNKKWNSVLSELKNLSDKSRKNSKNSNPLKQGYVHIGKYKVYSNGNNYSIENENGESLAKFNDLGKFNNEDLKLLNSILNLNKSK